MFVLATGLETQVNMASLLVGIAVFVSVYALKAPFHEAIIKDELDSNPWNSPEVLAPRGERKGFFEKWVRPTIRNFLPQTPMAALLAVRRNRKIAELLIRSGNPWNITPEEYLGVRLLAACAGFIVGTFLFMTGSLPEMIPPAVAVSIGPVLGWFIPRVLLDSARGKRRKQARQGLPEALDLLVITLNSGSNFTPALASVVERLPDGLIKDELARVSLDMRAGKSTSEALEDFARRAPNEDVEGFCKAVIQAESLGADVAQTLTEQAEAARVAYEAMLDEKIAKLQTTLFFPIMGFMLPALFLTILGPAFQSIGNAF